MKSHWAFAARPSTTQALIDSPTDKQLEVQVKRVIDPEAEALRLAEMRRLQRQMKGVKLQYIAENDTVFFDDVAGIGEAKVHSLPCLCHAFALRPTASCKYIVTCRHA